MPDPMPHPGPPPATAVRMRMRMRMLVVAAVAGGVSVAVVSVGGTGGKRGVAIRAVRMRVVACHTAYRGTPIALRLQRSYAR